MPSEYRKHKDTERKNKTRNSLLEAAITVFSKKGYHKTNISDIVDEAKVGQGTFYRNFTDKRDVFVNLIERFIFELIDKFSDMKTNQPTNIQEYRDASFSALNKMARHIEENRTMTRLFLREGAAVDRNFERDLEEIYDQFANIAKFHLDHAIEKGFARPCRSEIVAQSLMGVGLRMINAWANDRLPEITMEELISEISDFAFMGFGIVQGNELLKEQ